MRSWLYLLCFFCGFVAAHSNPLNDLPELHQAVVLGDFAKVKSLIDAGADVNQLDGRMGNAPVHIAAQTDHTEILKYLLDHGAFINLSTPRSGFTPLMTAAWYSKQNNIELLMSYPELNIELTNALGAKAQDMVGGWDRHITESEAALYQRLNALFIIKRKQQQELLADQKILNLIDSDLNEDQKYVQLKQLIEQGHDVNQRRPVYSNRNDWHTPLLVASREGYSKLVELLLDSGADQTIPGYRMDAIAFHKAGYMGHADIVKLLLKAPKAQQVLNAQGPNNGYTPLHDAIWHGNTQAARAFIQAGAKTQLRTYEQDTPEQLAERYGYGEIGRVLNDAK